MENEHVQDVVVVGAGIVGAATARTLAEAGRDVLLLERFERGHDRGSSHGATRIFRQGYTDDHHVRLTTRALAAWHALEAASGRSLLTLNGAVDHGDPEMITAIVDAFDRNGIAYERLAVAEAEARWPGFRFDREVLHHASAGRIASAEAIEALLDLAEAAGAALRFGVRVSDVRLDGGTVVIGTPDGDVTARSLVVAAGSWVPELLGGLLADAGEPLPEIVVTQEQPAHFPIVGGRPESDAAWPSFVHYRSGSGVGSGGTPGVYGLLTPGEGVKVGLHGTGPRVDPDERDFTAEPERLADLVRYVDEWIPGVDAAAPTPISCVYDTSPDEEFVIGHHGPIVYATGFSGHGFKFGPVLGELLAEHVLPRG
ncbi:FAD-dependent oxidoreductase [Plantibacter sp. YIM 135249]|uniref:FAD-dependent oxidoreductase n=1 Tax=Plantibacter sp. YIM 135249 TaxID=3423918 RepID=UPI003D339914